MQALYISDSKLTLKLKDSSIQKAKKYVLNKKTSLSALVENFFDSITSEEDSVPYSPLVQELSGIISLPSDYDYKSDYSDYLAKKYE